MKHRTHSITSITIGSDDWLSPLLVLSPNHKNTGEFLVFTSLENSLLIWLMSEFLQAAALKWEEREWLPSQVCFYAQQSEENFHTLPSTHIPDPVSRFYAFPSELTICVSRYGFSLCVGANRLFPTCREWLRWRPTTHLVIDKVQPREYWAPEVSYANKWLGLEQGQSSRCLALAFPPINNSTKSSEDVLL